VIDKEELVEAGHRYKEEILRLKQELLSQAQGVSMESAKNI